MVQPLATNFSRSGERESLRIAKWDALTKIGKKGENQEMKTKEEARANLEQSLTYVEGRYKQGVERADWATPASSDQAEKNFADSMAKVIAKKTRQAKIKLVSNSDWQQKASVKGGAVIAGRMRDSLDKQSAKWSPIYDRVVADLARLPARTVDFRTNITNRVVGTVESWKKHSGKL